MEENKMWEFHDKEIAEMARLALGIDAQMSTQGEPVLDEPDPDVIVIDDPKTGGRKRQPTWEDVEKARQEEKNKLYSRLTKAEEAENRLAELEAERKEREANEKKLAKEREAAEKKKAEEEMSLRQLLENKDSEWKAQLAVEQEERRKLEASLNLERRYSALQGYKARRLTEEADSIMPELRDFVRGNDEAEIDASIEDVKNRTAQILGQVQAHVNSNRAGMPTTRATAPPVGPMDQGASYQTYTADDIAGMSMEEYAAMRDRLLPAAGQARRGQPRR